MMMRMMSPVQPIPGRCRSYHRCPCLFFSSVTDSVFLAKKEQMDTLTEKRKLLVKQKAYERVIKARKRGHVAPNDESYLGYVFHSSNSSELYFGPGHVRYRANVNLASTTTTISFGERDLSLTSTPNYVDVLTAATRLMEMVRHLAKEPISDNENKTMCTVSVSAAEKMRSLLVAGLMPVSKCLKCPTGMVFASV